MHQLDRPCSRTRTRARRALLAASVAAAALVLPARPAAADSYVANTSGPIQVSGTYRPIVGNFSGDERDDIFWYAPGSGAEQLWIATGLPSQPFDKQPGDSVNGTYTPLVGNFGGDAYEEILWYAPGTATDILWTNPAGYFEPKSVRIDGTFTPLVMDNPGTWDAIFWYAAGPARDALWQFLNTSWQSTSYSINGTYQPFVLDQNGDLVDDIFWYAPGTTSDTLWVRRPNGGFNPYPKVVNGTYTPLVGDWSASLDSFEDILWSNPSGGDALWTSDIEGRTTSEPMTLPNRKAIVAESPGRDLAYFYSGSGADQVWRRDADGSTPTEVQTGYNAPDPSVALAGSFTGTSFGSLFFYRAGSASELLLF